MEDLCLNIIRETQLFRSKLDAMMNELQSSKGGITLLPTQNPQDPVPPTSSIPEGPISTLNHLEEEDDDDIEWPSLSSMKRSGKRPGKSFDPSAVTPSKILKRKEDDPQEGFQRGGHAPFPFIAPPARTKPFLPVHIQSSLDSNKYQVGDHVLVDMTNIPGWNRFMFCHLSGVVTATNLILRLPPHSRKDPRPAPLVPGPTTKEGGYAISIPSVFDTDGVVEVVHVFADRLQKDHVPFGGHESPRLSTLYDTFLRAVSEPRIIVEGEINSSLLVHVKVEEGGVVGWWEAFLLQVPSDHSEIGFQIVWFGDYHKHGKFAFAPLNDIRPAF
jgi:hypothetical protein